jgi:hypothetical protein
MRLSMMLIAEIVATCPSGDLMVHLRTDGGRCSLSSLPLSLEDDIANIGKAALAGAFAVTIAAAPAHAHPRQHKEQRTLPGRG